MVILRDLIPDDAPALTRIYSGASVRHTTSAELTLAQAQQKVHAALTRAADIPCVQWSWGILAADEMIGLTALRRRSPSMSTISYILREDTGEPVGALLRPGSCGWPTDAGPPRQVGLSSLAVATNGRRGAG
ncbi:GNAT family N-acetyltransferase [Streptomyces sp. NBC_00984]|uniref:GNAT family N-acetyltransferase n=1 Tax=Streptomyces sp. NBC_00984 TaxID=2903700 RepID=UPI003866880F|nr:GNAT family N-acetyltransferase [Streptomyces sp. NBC_00984]